MDNDIRKRSVYSAQSEISEESNTRIYRPEFQLVDDGEESANVWGFKDTQFRVDSDDNVEVTGHRYQLSGLKLPSLLPWMERMLRLTISRVPKKTIQDHAPVAVVDNRHFMEVISTFLSPSQIGQGLEQRTRHGHGHSQAEIYAVNFAHIPKIPDLVVYPESEAQVAAIVKAAIEHDVCLVPFGGGTNVSEALKCPADETRMIVSVDMKRMNRILWVDPVNRLACVEAGITGRHINQALSQFGLTIGHEPDSLEFSTLGGWIATNASGMKKNKYGNIEDIVLDLNMVTAAGVLTRPGETNPRESTGSDPGRYIFGSEGNLGIITSAIVKLFPLPASKKYGSILFPSFDKGLNFMYELTEANAQPASVRLVDNLQFQLSQVLKPASSGILARLKSWLEKLYVLKIKRFDPDSMVARTLVSEGTPDETRRQQASVYRIASQHGGLKAGAANGDRGYQVTFAIAYLRDFIMRHGIIAESFETSVPWSKASGLCLAVKERIKREFAARHLPGQPFVTCRVSQVYATGVTIYFYFAAYLNGVDDPSGVYAQIERAAREEILSQGGSLSHHHGIGKLRKDFLEQVRGPVAVQWNRIIKAALDPGNVFGIRNGSV